ncbi:MAG: DUF393 domain-containing protein [Planctomycetota bacterium]|nr:DUF393 domain-containing protein [Planctomycetota bacterium]
MNGNAKLPSPEDFPEADIVIYDGNCRFCRAQVERLHAWDPGNRLTFLSLHDERASLLTENLSRTQLMEQMYVIQRKTGTARGGAKALRYLSRRLPRLWLAAPLLHIPLTLPVWHRLYQYIANRRYQINGPVSDGCNDDGCNLPTDPKPPIP